MIQRIEISIASNKDRTSIPSVSPIRTPLGSELLSSKAGSPRPPMPGSDFDLYLIKKHREKSKKMRNRLYGIAH
jgi:hypothetical protein